MNTHSFPHLTYKNCLQSVTKPTTYKIEKTMFTTLAQTAAGQDSQPLSMQDELP